MFCTFFAEDENSQSDDSGSEADDEGIEQDHDDYEVNDVVAIKQSSHDVVKSVIDACASHLADSSEAESHYRKVCRALVAEAMTFDSFMEKRTVLPDIFDKELNELSRNQWAELWEKAMSDLRNGVKLKKTDFSKTPIEFALTPYEMLMDDIR